MCVPFLLLQDGFPVGSDVRGSVAERLYVCHERVSVLISIYMCAMNCTFRSIQLNNLQACFLDIIVSHSRYLHLQKLQKQHEAREKFHKSDAISSHFYFYRFVSHLQKLQKQHEAREKYYGEVDLATGEQLYRPKVCCVYTCCVCVCVCVLMLTFAVSSCCVCTCV